MKKIALNSLLVSVVLCGAIACNQESGAVEEAQTANEQRVEGTEMEDSMTNLSDFMTTAASGGMMEVELGNLAQQKAQRKEVKDFGQMMVTDHTKANSKLKELAQQKNIVLPDSMSQKHMEHVKNLREKSGAEFDKAYMDLMVSDHEEDVELFQDAAENLEDADVKSFAATTVATLQQHLERAKQINEMVKNSSASVK
ncbi:DUF4142 domain-containing protein [Pontibacter sp. CAU 1760]